MSDSRERDTIVQVFLDRATLPREFAEEMAAIILGESLGDIEPVPPLSLEERRKIGLGLTMEEARERMRQRAQALARSKAGD